jgi:DNA replication protein DnaC
MSEAAARQAVIEAHCRELKLPRVLREYAPLVRQARQDGWDYEEFLVQLLELEVHGRRDATAARRIREARFPDVKTLDLIDWEAFQGISRPKVLELASCDYLERGDDIVIAGPIGTGKTMLAIALGVEAARRRKRVVFVRAADLVRELLEARDQRELGRLQQRYRRVDLLGEWVQVFGDEKLTTALLDRLSHHAEILTTRGNSYRTRQRRRGSKKP